MPTYLYECPLHGEFEEYHSIMKTLETCPKCEEEKITPPNAVKRLINCSSKGTVELSGHEITAKMKEDVAQLKKDMSNSEKVYSNMLGEGNYQTKQKQIDEAKKVFRRK